MKIIKKKTKTYLKEIILEFKRIYDMELMKDSRWLLKWIAIGILLAGVSTGFFIALLIL